MGREPEDNPDYQRLEQVYGKDIAAISVGRVEQHLVSSVSHHGECVGPSSWNGATGASTTSVKTVPRF